MRSVVVMQMAWVQVGVNGWGPNVMCVGHEDGREWGVGCGMTG